LVQQAIVLDTLDSLDIGEALDATLNLKIHARPVLIQEADSSLAERAADATGTVFGLDEEEIDFVVANAGAALEVKLEGEQEEGNPLQSQGEEWHARMEEQFRQFQKDLDVYKVLSSLLFSFTHTHRHTHTYTHTHTHTHTHTGVRGGYRVPRACGLLTAPETADTSSFDERSASHVEKRSAADKTAGLAWMSKEQAASDTRAQVLSCWLLNSVVWHHV
jgi:hypothetical protein